MGELSLDGSLQPLKGVLPIAVEEELRIREDSILHSDSITAILNRVIGTKWKYKLAKHYKANDQEQLAINVSKLPSEKYVVVLKDGDRILTSKKMTKAH